MHWRFSGSEDVGPGTSAVAGGHPAGACAADRAVRPPSPGRDRRRTGARLVHRAHGRQCRRNAGDGRVGKMAGRPPASHSAALPARGGRTSERRQHHRPYRLFVRRSRRPCRNAANRGRQDRQPGHRGARPVEAGSGGRPLGHEAGARAKIRTRSGFITSSCACRIRMRRCSGTSTRSAETARSTKAGSRPCVIATSACSICSQC